MAEVSPNAAAMAEVLGVAPADAQGALAGLGNPDVFTPLLGTTIAESVVATGNPQDPSDPITNETVLADLNSVQWADREPQERLAAAGFFLGQLGNLGFAVSLGKREGA